MTEEVLRVEEQLRESFKELTNAFLTHEFETKGIVKPDNWIVGLIRKCERDVLSVLKQHRTPEQKELQELLEKRPKPVPLDVLEYFEILMPKLSAFLDDYALREAELKKLTQDLEEKLERLDRNRLYKPYEIINIYEEILKRLVALQLTF